MSAPSPVAVAPAAHAPKPLAGHAPPGAAPAGSGDLPGPARPASRGFGRVLEAASRATGAVPRPAAPAVRGAAAAALDVLGRLDGARARLDAVLAEARRGRSFTAAELLCLQADAHRFAQTVELAARAAEQGVQGVKHAVHLQV